MFRVFLRAMLLAAGISASAASAEPIKLKLSPVTSDRALIHLGGVKPFDDAVNAEAKGLLEIEIYFSDALEKQPSNPGRKLIDPTPADRATAAIAFKSVIDEWAAKSPDNRRQLDIVQAETDKLRAGR
jgi:hypothetical protein